MKVVAFLPAKGSSSRIENKNVKLLDGKPLFLHTLDKLLACSFIDGVYLDSESEEVFNLAQDRRCHILRRSPDLASNTTDGNRLFMNEVAHIDADIYIQILCTSPFIEVDTLEKGIKSLSDNPQYDSVVLVKKEKQYQWKEGRPSYDIDNIPNSVNLDDITVETMGLYIIRREAALKTQRRVGNNPLLLEASPLEAIDVNWPSDFELAEVIQAGRREKDRRLLNNIKGLLSSAMLSDLLDDHGYPAQIVRGLMPNLPQVKIFGRAKTLRLRPLIENEDFKGIYTALETYANIVPNDVIVVENAVPEYAYFGELNANLAIRSGAEGVIVGGMTRDSADVINLGLPVFAKGYSCQDVRKRATVDHMNRPVCIEGVNISPEDLIFGDREGIVVIPRIIERKIIDAAFVAASNEKRITIDISLGYGVDHLTKEYGFF